MIQFPTYPAPTLDHDAFEDSFFQYVNSWRVSEKALNLLRSSNQAREVYLAEDYSEYVDLLRDAAKKFGKKLEELPAFTQFEEYKPASTRVLESNLDSILNDLRGAYVVYLSALFEEHVKQALRCLFHNDLHQLKPDRTIPLGRLVSSGFEDVIRNEIEHAIAGFDRKCTEDQLDFLEDRFGITFFDEPGRSLLITIRNLRNHLVHLPKLTKVLEFDIRTTALVLLGSAFSLSAQVKAVNAESVVCHKHDLDKFIIDVLCHLPKLEAYLVKVKGRTGNKTAE